MFLGFGHFKESYDKCLCTSLCVDMCLLFSWLTLRGGTAGSRTVYMFVLRRNCHTFSAVIVRSYIFTSSVWFPGDPHPYQHKSFCQPFPLGCCSVCAHAMSLQLCSTLCDPMDCSLPGSPVHGILQARILEWVAVPYSRGSSQPRDRTHISCGFCSAGEFFTAQPLGKPT